MDPVEMRRRFTAAKVARLATVSGDGRPHIVPITFAMAGETVYFAVDHKPKATTDLKRLRNIEANPAVSVLVDHYEDDWSRLWWVRADGRGRILRAGADFESAIAVLTERYGQYRADRPSGPVVAIAVERITGWSAS
ncbi:MAG TPA: TIGR03668 family PPOX class F420-dependent oxidoreductase [Candidatus Dormibacteraeota bacterium]|nr:TIGR03668 family PPOX class F420-dependent oxidoreductase [Candidatus Dormibacteraeota bacterium]